MNSNAALEYPAATDGFGSDNLPLPTELSSEIETRRVSPLAAIFIIGSLSFAMWAMIWVALRLLLRL